jgi:Phosphopantetheine attachment site
MKVKMDSLDTVEMVMSIEEFLDIEIADREAESIGSPRELVDVLEKKLSNSKPNRSAKLFLKKLASDQQRPELAEGLERTWRREQIAALVREVLRDKND